MTAEPAAGAPRIVQFFEGCKVQAEIARQYAATQPTEATEPEPAPTTRKPRVTAPAKKQKVRRLNPV